MSELDLTKLTMHFSQSNKAEGKSPKTIIWYTEMLTSFTNFLRSRGANVTLGEFNMTFVREFLIREQEKGLSPYTIQDRVRALKAFSSWLLAERYSPENLLANLKLPKAPVKIIEPLTSLEIDKLLSIQKPLTAIGSRNIAILITLLDTGLRVSELCNLRFADSHIEEGYLKVLGKGNKERFVPIGSVTQKVLWRYVFHFKPSPGNGQDNSLFLSLYGDNLKSNAIKLLLKRWGRNAGVPRLHAHLCRHTFATSFLNKRCGDVFRLQLILGHTSLDMVRKYVHLSSTQDMINGLVSSPVDHYDLKKLNGYKTDRLRKYGRI